MNDHIESEDEEELLPTDHLFRCLRRHNWPEALDCLNTHRDEIEALEPRLKADLLALVYGRRALRAPWECNIELLDQMLQLDAPVSTVDISHTFGPCLFERVTRWENQHLSYRNEDDTTTPLKIQVLERLYAQMQRVGVIRTTALEVTPYTPQTFVVFFLNAGPLTMTPLRLQLFALIIKVFNVSFSLNPSHRNFLNTLIMQGQKPELIRFLANRGMVDWSVQIENNTTREQWITTAVEQAPGNLNFQFLYRVMLGSKMEALAAGRHTRLGAGSQTRRLLPEITDIVDRMLRAPPPPPQ